MAVGLEPSTFNLAVPEIQFGLKSVESLGERVKGLGAKSVLVVTDEGVVRAGILERVQAILARGGLKVGVFDQVEKEPSLENVDLAVRQAGGDPCEAIVGLGGGSAMDVAKLLAVLARHGGTTRDYLGIDRVPGRGIPTICIPTTSGTGSEITKNAIFDDRLAKTKLIVSSPHLTANLALIDPELTLTMPPSVTAASGADAFIHAVEGYLSPKASPLSDALALEAIRVIAENLPLAYANGSNIRARYGMAYGSMLGGILLNAAGASASHALAYPIGSQYHVPHGVACMLTFLEIMAQYRMASPEKFVAMASAMGLRTEALSVREAGERGIEEMRRMADAIEIPHALRAIQMDRNLIGSFAKSVVANQQRLLANGPRMLSERDIRGIYERSFVD